MTKLVRISLSLEESLLEQLASMQKKDGYENRSEYIRDLIRSQIARREWIFGEEVIGTLSLIYNHYQRGLSEKLINLRGDDYDPGARMRNRKARRLPETSQGSSEGRIDGRKHGENASVKQKIPPQETEGKRMFEYYENKKRNTYDG